MLARIGRVLVAQPVLNLSRRGTCYLNHEPEAIDRINPGGLLLVGKAHVHLQMCMGMDQSVRISVSTWFDTLLATSIPLLLFLVGRKMLSPFTWSTCCQLIAGYQITPSTSTFSLARAYNSYFHYTLLARRDLEAMEYSYNSIGRSQKHLGFRIGYPTKLKRLGQSITQNTITTTAIATLAAQEFGLDEDPPSLDVNEADLARVRESLKHFVRDWSEEGAGERERIFQPILRVLEQVPLSERKEARVLVPGCGLGRLTWEISQLGFNTRAVEISYFMTLAMRFLFSPVSTPKRNAHTIQPFAHWFSHQRSNDSLFRSVSFPDVVPRFSPTLELIEDDFLKTATPSRSKAREDHPGYDFVVTLFFIDTSINVFSAIEKIYSLLRPGGTWINLGPLLWPGGAKAKVELSLEELMHVVKDIGFGVCEGEGAGDVREPRTIECEYAHDRDAMMRWIYHAEFWVAKKQPLS